MTRSLERPQVETPLLEGGRYRVESEPIKVEDSEKGSITVERHIAPQVYRGEEPALLIANGWGEGCDTLEVAATELAQSGRAVYTFNHRRSWSALGNPEAYKASTLSNVYEAVAEQEDAVTVLAHSEGAIGSIMMAVQMVEEGNADKLSGLELVAPAGLTRLELAGLEKVAPEIAAKAARTSALFFRGCYEMAQHGLDIGMARSLGMRGIMAVALYSTHAPLGMKELWDISDTDLSNEVRFISEAGVPVGIIGCRRDKIIPIEALRAKAAALADAGVLYREVGITHMQFLTKPEVVRAMLGQAGDLEAMQAPVVSQYISQQHSV